MAKYLEEVAQDVQVSFSCHRENLKVRRWLVFVFNPLVQLWMFFVGLLSSNATPFFTASELPCTEDFVGGFSAQHAS